MIPLLKRTYISWDIYDQYLTRRNRPWQCMRWGELSSSMHSDQLWHTFGAFDSLKSADTTVFCMINSYRIPRGVNRRLAHGGKQVIATQRLAKTFGVEVWNWCSADVDRLLATTRWAGVSRRWKRYLLFLTLPIPLLWRGLPPTQALSILVLCCVLPVDFRLAYSGISEVPFFQYGSFCSKHIFASKGWCAEGSGGGDWGWAGWKKSRGDFLENFKALCTYLSVFVWLDILILVLLLPVSRWFHSCFKTRVNPFVWCITEIDAINEC